MVSDYLIVRRSKLRLSHLYMPNSNSIYYFTYGINFRALVAWVSGVWPLMRKFRSSQVMSHHADMEQLASSPRYLPHLMFRLDGPDAMTLRGPWVLS